MYPHPDTVKKEERWKIEKLDGITSSDITENGNGIELCLVWNNYVIIHY